MKHYKRKDTNWNEAAGSYDKLVGDSGSDYHQEVLIPGAIKLLKPQKNEDILDVGCGQGVFSRKLEKFGAEVTGIDSSSNLIKIAKERSKNFPNVTFHVADAKGLKMFDNESFDAASCIMAIQNMEPLNAIISEISRVLRIGGRFLIVMSHPAFRIPRQSGWGFDEKRRLQFRRVDSYLSEKKIPIKMHPGYDPKQVTWTFHRPLSSYFKAFYKNGLVAADLEEWITHRRTNEKADNRAREEFPLFLALLAVKI